MKLSYFLASERDVAPATLLTPGRIIAWEESAGVTMLGRVLVSEGNKVKASDGTFMTSETFDVPRDRIHCIVEESNTLWKRKGTPQRLAEEMQQVPAAPVQEHIDLNRDVPQLNIILDQSGPADISELAVMCAAHACARRSHELGDEAHIVEQMEQWLHILSVNLMKHTQEELLEAFRKAESKT